MKPLALVLASTFLLTGCASVLGGDQEPDAKACESLVSLTSPDTLDLSLLDTANLANEIRTTAAPLAGADFAGKVESLATELEKDPIDTAAIAPIAAELALRCAVVGVSFDFGSVTGLLG